MSSPSVGALPDEYDPVAIGLEGRRADWDVVSIPLRDLAEQLRSRYGASILIDDASLKIVNMSAASLVSLRLKNVNLTEAIWGIAPTDSGGDEFDTLAFRIVGDTIVIGVEDYSSRGAVLRAYDVKPLVAKLRPHQDKLAQLLPEPPHRGGNQQGPFGALEPEAHDQSLLDAGEGMMYHLATSGAVVEDRFPTVRAAGVVFVEAPRDKHQRIVRRLNELMMALDQLGAPVK